MDSFIYFCQDVDDVDLIIIIPFIVTPTILHHSQAKTINFDHEWSWWLVKSSNTMTDSMLQSSSEMDRFRVVITQWSADQVENENGILVQYKYINHSLHNCIKISWIKKPVTSQTLIVHEIFRKKCIKTDKVHTFPHFNFNSTGGTMEHGTPEIDAMTFSNTSLHSKSIWGRLRNIYCRAHWTFGGDSKQHTFCTVTEEENITTIEFIHQRMKWGFSQTNTIQFWQTWPQSWIVLWRDVGRLRPRPSSRNRGTLLNIPYHDTLDIINFHLFMVCFGWTELIITICFTWHWDICSTFSNITLFLRADLHILIMLAMAAVSNCVWYQKNEI